MNPEKHEKISEIVARALELTEHERAEYLATACGDDQELLKEVNLLLANEADLWNSTGLFEPVLSFTDEPIENVTGSEIGPYRIREKIGSGGFGDVYVADQQKPVKRRVAIKVIKPGMDSREVLARFQAEQQALALMDHPNIAKVLDAGTTQHGHPYFVMEYVKGESVTEFCRRHETPLRERLAIFSDICDAIQHAHQKGIVHRDIKPSNILVEYIGEKPVPRVIDFGVAKALNQQLTEHSIFTKRGQIIGTPAYMSPEQAEMSGLDVDTRSDIYSLGVLLYELLTGESPFDKQQFREAALNEIHRIIREVEPLKPSSKISTINKSESKNGAGNSTTGARESDVRGDLDWITMKALEKDRARRYPSASDFKSDIERYLGDEPVSAGPPSAYYVFSKFARRNRRLVFAAASIFAVLVVSVIAIGASLTVARNANEQLKIEKQLADDARIKAETVAEFVQDIFRGIDPLIAKDKDTTLLRERLDYVANRLEAELIDQPLIKAELHSTIGNAYSRISENKPAEKHLKLAHQLRVDELGQGHIKTLLSYCDFGQFYSQIKSRKGIEILSECNKKILTHPDATKDDIRHVAHQLINAYVPLGMYKEARKVFQEIPQYEDETERDQVEKLGFQLYIFAAEKSLGENIELAKDYHQKTIEISGSSSPSLVWAKLFLAQAYEQLEDKEEAYRCFSEAYDLGRRTYGPSHWRTQQALSLFASCARSLNRMESLQEILDDQISVESPTHPSSQFLLSHVAINVGDDKMAKGDLEDAEKYFRKSYSLRLMSQPQSWVTFAAMDNIGRCLIAQKRHQEALPFLLGAYTCTNSDERWKIIKEKIPSHLQDIFRKTKNQTQLESWQDSLNIEKNPSALEFLHQNILEEFGPDHIATLQGAVFLAECYRKNKQFEPAIKLLSDVIDRCQYLTETLHGNWFVLEALMAFANVNLDAEDFKTTASITPRLINTINNTVPVYPPHLAEAHEIHALALSNLGRNEEAIESYEKAIEVWDEENNFNHQWLSRLSLADVLKTHDPFRSFELYYHVFHSSKVSIEFWNEHRESILRSVNVINSSNQLDQSKVKSFEVVDQESLAFWQPAVKMATEMIGSDNPMTQEATVRLAIVHRDAGQLEEADRLVNDLIDNKYAAHELNQGTVTAVLKYAESLLKQGFDESVDRCIELCRDHIDLEKTIWNIHHLGWCAKNLGKPHRAIQLFETELSIRDKLEDADAGRARARHSIASVYCDELMNYKLAATIWEDILPGHAKAAGYDHSDVRGMLTGYCWVLYKLGQTEKAVDVSREHLTALPISNPTRVDRLSLFAKSLERDKQYKIAAQSYKEVADTYRNWGGHEKDLADVLDSRRHCIRCLNQDISIDEYNELLSLRRRVYPQPEEHDYSLHEHLGNVFSKNQDYTKAKECFEECLRLADHLSHSNDKRVNAYKRLADVEHSTNRKREAIRYLEQAVQLIRENDDVNFELVQGVFGTIRWYYDQVGESASAIRYGNEAVEHALKHGPNNHDKLGNAYANLAFTYDGAKQPEKAQAAADKVRPHLKALIENQDKAGIYLGMQMGRMLKSFLDSKDEAEEVYRSLFEVPFRNLNFHDHQRFLEIYDDLYQLLNRDSRTQDVIALLRDRVAYCSSLPSDKRYQLLLLESKNRLFTTLADNGFSQEAVDVGETTLELADRLAGFNDYETYSSYRRLANAYVQLSRSHKEKNEIEKSNLLIRKGRKYADDALHMVTTSPDEVLDEKNRAKQLYLCYRQLGRLESEAENYEAAVKNFREGIRILEKHFPESADLSLAHRRLGVFFEEKMQDSAKSLLHARKSYFIQKELFGLKSANTRQRGQELVANLVRSKSYDEAMPIASELEAAAEENNSAARFRAAYKNNLAWLIINTKMPNDGQLELAKKKANQACELTGFNNADFLHTYSLTLEKTGDISRALEISELAIERVSDDDELKETIQDRIKDLRSKLKLETESEEHQKADNQEVIDI